MGTKKTLAFTIPATRHPLTSGGSQARSVLDPLWDHTARRDRLSYPPEGARTHSGQKGSRP